ncbi:hypothetical protein J1N35_031947 [Gossypium stocksii]|uniref:Uncharacterized protein n=1 Tax=Gossypium stocksii TaxID=47602 RepID=A0A9D3V2K6_9ROSI|nr:hypothetical protein J1N35_031947 [Gossypium stocksii]
MASSLALTRLVSSNILPSPLRVAIAPSTSRIFNTNAATRDDCDLNDDRCCAYGFFSIHPSVFHFDFFLFLVI